MKTIKLLNLKLRNFKGVKEFELSANGENVNVYGRNEAGKSTLFDAFTWLLFDKNSSDTSTTHFSIKTLDKDGNTIHGLEHEVIGVLLVDGVKLELRKVYREKWVNKKGEANKTFEGNTTDYFIDDVPVKKSAYTEEIDKLVSEDMFKLVTNPAYFNEKISWEDRRRTLFEVIGNFTDQQVIDSNSSLSILNELLAGKELDKFKAAVTAKKKKLKKEREKIPVRIDEAHISIQQIDLDKETIDFRLKNITGSIKKVENQILDKSEVYNQANVIKSEIFKKESNLQDIRNEQMREAQEIQKGLQKEIFGLENSIKNEIYEKKNKLRDIEHEQKRKAQEPKRLLQQGIYNSENELNKINYDIQVKDKSLNYNKKQIEEYTERMTQLRNSWNETCKQELKFDPNQLTCPTCGQKLPEEDVEKKKAEMLENLERDKKVKKDRINKEGKQLKASVAKMEQENEKLLEQIFESENIKTNLMKELESKKKQYENMTITMSYKTEEYKKIEKEVQGLEKDLIEKVEEKKNQAKKTVFTFVKTEEYKQIEKEIQELESTLIIPDDTDLKQLKEKKAELEKEKEQYQNMLRISESNEKIHQRIEELKQKESFYSNEITKLEGQENLCINFEKEKVNMLESKINQKFKNVRFKLFHTFNEGNSKPCCETLIKGVPYKDANSAGRANGGLETINVLAKHCGVQAPIFVDNKEGINKLIDTPSQVISLIVSEDKKLKYEIAHIPTEEEKAELRVIIKQINENFGDRDKTFNKPLGFEFTRKEYGEKHRWTIERFEYYRYKGQVVVFKFNEPLTEMQSDQDTNPEIYIVEGDE